MKIAPLFTFFIISAFSQATVTKTFYIDNVYSKLEKTEMKTTPADTFEVDQDTMFFVGEGGFKPLELICDTTWKGELDISPWADETYRWVSLTSNGNGNASVAIVVQSNNSTTQRTMNVIFTTATNLHKNVCIIQEGRSNIVEVDQDTVIFSTEAGVKQLQISSNNNVAWGISNRPSWLTVSESGGNGNSTVTLGTSTNNTSALREADITITAGNYSRMVHLLQPYVVTGATLEVDRDTIIFDPGVSIKQMSLTSNTTWHISNKPSWLTVTPTASGQGNTTIILGTPANHTGVARTATIVVWGGSTLKTVYLIQPYADSPTDTLEVDQDTIILAPAIGSKQLVLTCNTAWTATCSEPSWIYVSPANGNGNATIDIWVAKNNAHTPRSATITFLGNVKRVVTIIQATSFIDTLKIDLDTAAFASAGESRTLKITCNNSWLVTSKPSWLSMSSSGTNNYTTQLVVTPNPTDSERIGDIIIKSETLVRTVRVRQLAGTAPTVTILEVDSEAIHFGSGIETRQLNITCNTTWSVTKTYPSGTPDWVTITSATIGQGNAIVTLNSIANTTTAMRGAYITIKAGELTKDVLLLQDFLTGIAEVKEIRMISAYPNPSNGMITVQNQVNGDASVEVFNLNGVKVDTFTLPALQSKTLDYSVLPSGIFMLHILSADVQQHMRLLISR